MDEVRNIAVIAGTIVAVLTLVKASIEYSRQGLQKRMEHFFSLEKRLTENREFLQILEMLEFDKPEIELVPFLIKRELLGLFEEVAVTLESHLIREEVALYFFGYYAIDCWQNNEFWHDINRDGSEWIVLKEFVNRMQQVEKRAMSGKCRYRF